MGESIAIQLYDIYNNINNALIYNNNALAEKGVSNANNIYEIGDKIKLINIDINLIRDIISRSITDIDIPDNIIKIGDYLFFSSFYLSRVNTNMVKEIGIYAFAQCSALNELILTNYLQSINNYAFYNCSNLSNVTIPDSVNTIGSYAFSYCKKLLNAHIGNGINDIPDDMFSNCSNLNTVTFSNNNNIKSIGINAFYNASALKNILLPDSIEIIGSNAFYRCTSLETITLPSSLRQVNGNAFQYCNNLLVDFTNSLLLEKINGFAIQNISNTNIILPNSVLMIGPSAFRACENLTYVEIGTEISSIEQLAFAYCSQLSKVKIKGKPESIKSQAFYYATNLTALILESDVLIPLENTNVLWDTPIASGNGYIYVPASLVDTYKSATNWSTYANQFRAIEDYSDIVGG